MDSNHVINVFSLYCAGQLLQNPERDVAELTREISVAAVGEEYAAAFSDVLWLLEDARSGYDWESYFWSRDNYILKSDSYPAKEILQRSEVAMSLLKEMIANRVESNTLPLPISMTELLKLILPQIEQIHDFAVFRLQLDEARALAQAGNAFDSEEFTALLEKMSIPVSEYNTVTGLWRQIEARAQMELLEAFCAQYQLEMPVNPTFKQTRKNRIYDYFVSYQLGHDTPFLLYDPYFQYGLAYGRANTLELIEELISENLLIRNSDGGVYLADWEHYKYSFN